MEAPQLLRQKASECSVSTHARGRPWMELVPCSPLGQDGIPCVMYDRVSLAGLLKTCGFVHRKVVTAFSSHIAGFSNYGLDVVEGAVRKPDSLFMEAVKP